MTWTLKLLNYSLQVLRRGSDNKKDVGWSDKKLQRDENKLNIAFKRETLAPVLVTAGSKWSVRDSAHYSAKA
jgi:hypothetical protein